MTSATGQEDLPLARDIHTLAPVPPVQIACDESGYEGERLVDGTTGVFTHGSVRIDHETAVSCMRELRRRIQSPATEYKANHLLRQKHRPVLTWLLGPSGPLYGKSHVCLIDKTYFAVVKMVEMLLLPGGGSNTDIRLETSVAQTAGNLYRDGRLAFDPGRWRAFLMAANNLLRGKGRLDPTTPVQEFVDRLDDLCRTAPDAGAVAVLERLRAARPKAEVFRQRLQANPTMIPVIDPLIPGIAQTVIHWGAAGGAVAVVHDRQNSLPDERIAQLKSLFNGRSHPGDSPVRLASLSLVNSFVDPRVQIADILAGTARKIAEEELNNRGDAELTRLLRPYVDQLSIWGDDRSWRLLRPELADHDSS